ncbi:MAG: hypothetical protein NVSMB23_18960 [Myxococcales bacterium]
MGDQDTKLSRSTPKATSGKAGLQARAGARLKPASETPITGGLLFAKISEEAGLPPGVLSVVVGAGSEVGDAFVKHPVPRVISFTGSTPVGRHIGEREWALEEFTTDHWISVQHTPRAYPI